MAKYAGSCSGASTPGHTRSLKDTSPTVPSSNSRRSWWSPTTTTPLMIHSGRLPAMFLDVRPVARCSQRFGVASKLPVAGQLVLVKQSPVADQPRIARGQRASQNLAVERDGRFVRAVAGMEVRRLVAALIPIHRDDDAEELADPWHLRILSPQSDEGPKWETGAAPQASASSGLVLASSAVRNSSSPS